MRVAFELAGEHPPLPRADALAALEAERVPLRSASFTAGILIVDAVRPPRRALERVALSRYVDRVLAVGPLPSILRAAARVDIGDASFRVRAHGPFNPEEKRDLERRIGGAMPATGRVDLDAPDPDFRLLRTQGGVTLGEVLVAVARSAMEARHVARVDAIATDPPYGRAASPRGESIASLYRRAFAAFREILPRGGFAAVALPSEEAVRIGEEFLELEEAHTLQVHRTLARTFVAFVRSR